jgi:uncharacterized protein YacL (UPF0231 family)
MASVAIHVMVAFPTIERSFKMSIINKINEYFYTVGTYTITKQDDRWLLVNNKSNRNEALYFDRDTAIRTAIMMYASGQLVAEGTRDFLKMVAKEMHPEWELDE